MLVAVGVTSVAYAVLASLAGAFRCGLALAVFAVVLNVRRAGVESERGYSKAKTKEQSETEGFQFVFHGRIQIDGFQETAGINLFKQSWTGRVFPRTR